MLFILCAIVAICLLVWCFKSRGYADSKWWCAALIIAAVNFVLGLFFLPSLLVLSEIITYLIMPIGLVWLTCLGAAIITRGLKRALWLTLFLLIGFSGSPWVGNFLLYTLERPYRNIDPFAVQGLDAVVLLGGGTNDPSPFRAQLGESGDRILLAMAMVEKGQSSTLIITGSSTAQDHSAQTKTILSDIGSDKAEIILIPEAMNTRQEIKAIKPLIAAAGWEKVGVISSGWHLRRVMKLAEREGLSLQPLPADLRGTWIDHSAHTFFPQARGFTATQLALKEYIGAMVGR